MPALYPIFLDLAERPCLVVGGGRVAERKVEGLMAAGARVTVVSPKVSSLLGARAAKGEVLWHPRAFAAGDVEGMRLVFVATSDPAVNRAANAAARERGIWLNSADAPGSCDFFVPAVSRREGVSVAVSTEGASPAAAAWIRDRIGEALPPRMDRLLTVLRALRRASPREGVRDGDVFRRLLDTGVASDLANEDWEAADDKVSLYFADVSSVTEILGHSSTEST